MNSPARRHRLFTPANLRSTALPVALVMLMLLGATLARIGAQTAHAALYPDDRRQAMTEADASRFAGAGVLMCYSDFGTLERAAAAWLVGSHDLVVMNAHNFVDRRLVPTHPVTNCFFRIAGGDYYFDENSLRIGASVESKALHITDDWALLRLLQPTPETVKPQPSPDVERCRHRRALQGRDGLAGRTFQHTPRGQH